MLYQIVLYLCLFGEIEGETMRLNPVGEVVQHAWLRMPSFFPIYLDAYMLMPNHFHGIICTGEASAARVIPIIKIVPADASPQPPSAARVIPIIKIVPADASPQPRKPGLLARG